MKQKERKISVLYNGLMDDLNLDLENTYLGFAIYHSIRSDSPYFNITKADLALGIHKTVFFQFPREK